jgi:hypothetical protein
MAETRSIPSTPDLRRRPPSPELYCFRPVNWPAGIPITSTLPFMFVADSRVAI